MKRALVFSLIVAGAGCGNDGNTNVDGGGNNPGVDLTMTAQPDMATPKPDMAVPPPAADATKIATGTHFLYGITPDNNVIAVSLNQNNALVAIPVAGGQAQTISPSGWTMMLHNSSVFDWEAVDQDTHVGQANLWRKATGTKPLANGDNAVSGIGDFSPDSNYVAYSGGAAVDGTATDLYVAKADTTGAVKFASGGTVDTAGDTTVCSTHVDFDAQNHLIALVCGQGDLVNGAKGNALLSVDPATGKATTLYGRAGIWYVTDPAGKYVAANDDAGKLWLFPVGGGNPIAVDSDVSDRELAFLPDGSAMVYITTGGALKRATVGAMPAPVTLIQNNVTRIRRFNINRDFIPAVSPDGKWVVISNEYDDSTGIGDIFMASTSTPGMPTTLVPDATGEIFGDAFTMDSQFVLYYTMTAQLGSGLVGTFNAKPVAGGNSVQFGTKVWVSYDGAGTISGFNDNYKAGKPNTFGDYGTADFKIVDVANPAKVKTVAVKGDAEFWPTPDRKTFVFSVRASAASAGVYSIPASTN